MKKAYILFFLISLPVIYSAVEINNYVNDYAGILSGEEKAQTETVLKTIHESGTAEYSVVIINNLEGQEIRSYAYNLAEGKLGDSEKDNGLLLLVAIDDRQYDFEVGRGLEPIIPDIIVGRIGRTYLVPNFREGNYGKGILEASLAVKSILLNESDSAYSIKAEQDIPAQVIIIIVIITIFIIISVVRSLRGRKSGKRKNEDYFTAAWLLGSMMKGRGRGGFSGGGFGGFGGGSFGGGGAGSSW